METQSPRSNCAEAKPEKSGAAGEERKSPPWKRETMTEAQLQEFQMQAMAYRYISAGHPLPPHLLVPIWNSLALSWSRHLSMVHHLHRLSYQEFYQREMVDPEPTRCRRTDGKKWRCGNDVLPFQKYCQRHMHRGRKRSRKLVESSEIASSDPKASMEDGSDSFSCHQTMASSSSSKAPVVTIASYADEDKSSTIQDSVSLSSFVSLASTNKSVTIECNGSGRNVDLNDNDKSNRFMSDDFIMKKQKDMIYRHGRLPSVQSEPKDKPGRYPEITGKQCRSSEDGLFIGKYLREHLQSGTEVSGPPLEAADFIDSSKKDISTRNRLTGCNYSAKSSGMNVTGCMVPGIHFSPDSVLQGHGGFPLNRAETENEPGRCRRTDGKKWRCSKEALPFQKYCPKHMHRGVKKRPGDTKAVANTGVSVSYSMAVTAAGSASCKDKDDHNAKLNTELSVSVLANPLVGRGCEEKSTSSCSTDTTITDTALRGEDKDKDDLSTCSGV
ncbi:PREDICTED: growth-regulating factor 9 isoform X2 [Tarenaya hassleriana]|uniref:growth-regulating factor 9 isoform X2 n=1 Tax=Tarenaya hassleriana TaxID=28532 RepID=UPI00053C70C7|nr:PREDICTED: growth-regulating factor 9 isoform X2 [Tarenaya hassleriana]